MSTDLNARLQSFLVADDREDHDIAAANQLVADFPDAPQAWAARARTYAKRGNKRAAQSDVAQALKLDPASPDAVWVQSFLANEQGEDQVRMIALLDETLARVPTHYGCLLARGWIHDLRDEPEGAIACWVRAIESQPTLMRALNNVVTLLCKHGRYDEVAAIYAIRARAAPPDGQNEYNIGTMLYDAKQYALAIEYLDRGRSLLGEQNAIQHNRALCLEKLARHEEAVAEWTSVLAREPDWDWPRLGRSRSLRALERYSEALADVHVLLQDTPDDPDLLAKAAGLHLELADYAQVVVVVDRLIELDGKQPWPLNLRGLAHLKLGALDLAERDLNAALSEDAEYFLARRNCARLKLAQGLFAQAQAQAEIAIALDPDDSYAHLLRAQALAAQGKHGEAAQVYAARLDQAQDDAPARLGLAECLLAQKQWAKAQTHYEVLQRKQRNDPELAHALARCEAGKRRNEAARVWYKKAQGHYLNRGDSAKAELCGRELERLSRPAWSIWRLFGRGG